MCYHTAEHLVLALSEFGHDKGQKFSSTVLQATKFHHASGKGGWP